MAYDASRWGKQHLGRLFAVIMALVVSMVTLSSCTGGGNTNTTDNTTDNAPDATAASAWVLSKIAVTTEGDASSESTTTYELDEHGSHTGMTFEHSSSDDPYVYTYELDEDGYIKSSSFTTGDSDPTVAEAKLEKDDQGRLIRCENESTVEEYTYDDEGNPASYTRVDTFEPASEGEDPVQFKVHYVLDANGFPTEMTQDSTGYHIDGVFTYERDDEGVPTAATAKITVKDDEGEVTSEYDVTYAYTYDENGNLASFVREDPMSKTTTTLEYVEVEDPSPAALLYSIINRL